MQATAHRTRRPSGDPPPLPRDSHATGWLWASLAVVLVGIGLAFILTNDPDLHDFGSNVVEWFADLRTPWLTQVAKGVVLISSFGAVQLLRLAIAGALIATKRFRHLVVALASFVLVDWLVLTFLSEQRPAPGVSVAGGQRQLHVPVLVRHGVRDHGVRDAVRAGARGPDAEASDDGRPGSR